MKHFFCTKRTIKTNRKQFYTIRKYKMPQLFVHLMFVSHGVCNCAWDHNWKFAPTFIKQFLYRKRAAWHLKLYQNGLYMKNIHSTINQFLWLVRNKLQLESQINRPEFWSIDVRWDPSSSFGWPHWSATNLICDGFSRWKSSTALRAILAEAWFIS